MHSSHSFHRPLGDNRIIMLHCGISEAASTTLIRIIIEMPATTLPAQIRKPPACSPQLTIPPAIINVFSE